MPKGYKEEFLDTYYVRAYELARQGLKGNGLAAAMNIDHKTLKRWKDENEAFRDAIERGRALFRTASGKTKEPTFKDYVFERLPDNLKRLWERIEAIEKEDNSVQKLELMMEREGMYVRMHLFIHAYVTHNFNLSAACRTLNVPLPQFYKWVREEPDFGHIIDEINFHKKNFFEAALVRLVKEGEPSAVLFANKTFNADRGYNPKVDINIHGQVNHTHTMIDLDVLDLPLDVLKVVMDAVRKQREVKPKNLTFNDKTVETPALPEDVLEGEFEVVEKEDAA